MYWLQRPPYLRRLGAAALLLGAFLWDLRAAATEPYPTASHALDAGSRVSSEDVTWIEIPAGRLPVPALEGAVTTRDVAPGEPLTAALLTRSAAVPDGWWTVPIDVGGLAVPGDEVMLVVVDPPLTSTGLVVAAQVGDRFSLDFRPAAVAVPPDIAPVIAAAEREGILVTAVRGTTGER